MDTGITVTISNAVTGEWFYGRLVTSWGTMVWWEYIVVE